MQIALNLETQLVHQTIVIDEDPLPIFYIFVSGTLRQKTIYHGGEVLPVRFRPGNGWIESLGLSLLSWLVVDAVPWYLSNATMPKKNLLCMLSLFRHDFRQL